jgi:isoleucyl-tRNA synthetase
VEVEAAPLEGFSVSEEGDLVAGINVLITEKLESEGLARDIVRRIQALRKEADFNIDDRIETHYSGDKDVEAAFQNEAEYIMVETLSTTLRRGAPPEDAYTGEFDIDGKKLKLGLLRV